MKKISMAGAEEFLQEFRKRTEQIKTHMQTSTLEHQNNSLYKCNICSDQEMIYTFNEQRDAITSMKPCSCVSAKEFQKYDPTVDFSNRELQHTFKNAVMDDENKPHFEIAVNFIKNLDKHLEEGTWLYIFGDELRANDLSKTVKKDISAFGTGKTFIMQCIANALAYRKQPAIYINEEKLFGDIKATYERNSSESEQEVLRRYYKIPILMIDDIFTAQYKDWAEGKLFSILDARSNDGKITIFTSNYGLGRIKERLPMNGGKIASRITGRAQLIEMIGTDRRRTISRDRLNWSQGAE